MIEITIVLKHLREVDFLKNAGILTQKLVKTQSRLFRIYSEISQVNESKSTFGTFGERCKELDQRC